MGDPEEETAGSLPENLRAAAPDHALERAVGKSRVAAALFGDVVPVKIGRYTLIERVGAGGMSVVWAAFDGELDRPVALKLAATGDDAVRTRARDEGRALAKLSHPNVVPIYDVVDDDQGVFLVMELVRGETLRALPPDPDIILRAYRQAGEGLAAAHAAGLVHRDFKPDNAILGADGRVRVLDFGLANTGEATGVAGTPRYMAPEQRANAPLTAAVDQYAFCVALRESLETVPRWLDPILARGAAASPIARYPSMHDLLRALALDPRTRWRRRALVIGAIAAGGAIAAAFAIGRAQHTSPCEGGPALLAASWGPGARATAANHLARTDSPYARATSPRILTALDGYAGTWLRIHRTSCEAHRRGEISPDLLDRRAGCLARRRGALAAIAELATKATATELPQLVIAVGELPDLATCEDDVALLANVPPPSRAEAAEATAISELVARADVERDAGRYADATRDADAALARARLLGYRPLVARALHARGRISMTTYTEDFGASLFDACLREALAAGDDPLAIEAYARRAWARGIKDARADATESLALVEALLERTGDRARFARALLHMNLGTVELARGDRDSARRLYERARGEARAFAGAGAIELTNILSGLAKLTDDAAARTALADEYLRRRSELLGPAHPSTVIATLEGPMLLDDIDQARATLWPACRALARQYPNEGTRISDCGYEVAWLAAMSGDLATVQEAAALVAGTHEVGGAPYYVVLARAFEKLAAGERDAAREALVAFQAETAKQPRAWWLDLAIADAAAVEALVSSPEAAARAVQRARIGYAALADQMPSPRRHRREAALARLR